ncbi:MAG: (2Fe-2S)-binding protein [Halopseudomonas sp.]
MPLLNVNGRDFDVDFQPHETLSSVLRDKLNLIGTKVSCGEGECGSCTIFIDGAPTTSCLVLAGQVEGKAITTIEGLGENGKLDLVQQAFIDEQGFQCGYCTPGFIMAAKAFLEENPDPTEDEANDAMSGNICRCGAHPYIVKSVLKAAHDIKQHKRLVY